MSKGNTMATPPIEPSGDPEAEQYAAMACAAHAFFRLPMPDAMAVGNVDPETFALAFFGLIRTGDNGNVAASGGEGSNGAQ